MKTNAIKNLVIVGANATGWTAAFVLASYLKGLEVNIKVLDCADAQDINGAISLPPASTAFLQALGIDMQALMKATHATFNLGSAYVDWKKAGQTSFQPFGAPGVQKGFWDFHQLVNKLRLNGEDSSFEAYSLAAMAANAGKFGIANNQENPILANFTYGINADAQLFSQHLKAKALGLGVTLSNESIANQRQDALSDFFFDCSGEQALLMKQHKIALQDWSAWLPCDRVLSSEENSNEAKEDFKPQIQLTALPFGFEKRQLLQGKLVKTVVYSSRHHSNQSGRALNVGVRSSFWHKNCLALGAAAGVLDPLEIDNMALVVNGLRRFMKLYPQPDYQSNAFEYNRQTLQEYQLARDYHLLRYKLSQGDDSAFWQACQRIELPASLSHALALFKSHGRQPDYNEELIAKHRWVTSFTGQGVWPECCHPLSATVDVNVVAKEFAQMRNGIAKTVESMPDHQGFIQRFCGA